VDVPDTSRHIENRWCRIALLAKSPVPAAMHVIIADIVLTSRRELKVARALVQRRALGAATVPLMHARCHISLTFNHGSKISTKEVLWRTEVTQQHYRPVR